jgi:hypothetical protein
MGAILGTLGLNSVFLDLIKGVNLKNLGLSLLILLGAKMAMANVSCTAQVYIPGGYVSGRCFGTSCSASSGGQSLTASGECPGGLSFRANAYLEPEYMNGTCMSGSFSASVPGSSISWNGECSDGSPAQISSNYSPGSFVNGSCTENSSFSAMLPGQYISVQAYCQ